MAKLKIIFKIIFEGLVDFWISKSLYLSQLRGYQTRGWSVEAYSWQKMPNKIDFIIFWAVLFLIGIAFILIKQHLRSRKLSAK